jgi:hypothetical protein
MRPFVQLSKQISVLICLFDIPELDSILPFLVRCVGLSLAIVLQRETRRTIDLPILLHTSTVVQVILSRSRPESRVAPE